jgi:hypothetical protein
VQTLTLHIPEAQFSYIMGELNKFKDIKIEVNSNENSKEAIKEDIRQAVNELNLIKKGKSKARPAREFLNEL